MKKLLLTFLLLVSVNGEAQFSRKTLLFNQRIPAVAAGGAGPLATDNFNRADASPIGGNWTTITAESAMAISGNTCTYSSSVADCSAYYNAVTWPDNQYSQTKVTTASVNAAGSGIGVVVRASSSARTYYRLVIDAAGANNVRLKRSIAGSSTTLWTDTAAFTSGLLLRLEVTGSGTSTVLKAFYNGVQVHTDFTDNGGSAINTGNAGVAYSSVDSSGTFIDDWEGGSL